MTASVVAELRARARLAKDAARTHEEFFARRENVAALRGKAQGYEEAARLLEGMTCVPLAALRALIEYADTERMVVDGEFCCSPKERDDSQKEFDDIVAALNIPKEAL